MRQLRWIAAALVLSLPTLASAYCRTTTCRPDADNECRRDERDCVTDGTPLFWPSRCVGFSFQAQGTRQLVIDDAREAIFSAFATWSRHPCPGGGEASISFSPTEDVQCKLPQANREGGNVNVVFFRDDAWPYRGIDGTLATTTVTYDGNGAIWDADIAVNAAFNTVTLDEENPDYDVPSIVIHEVGHFLGIAHSERFEALMAPTYQPGVVRRELREDDIEALCEIYPPDRQASCSLEPRGGFASRCNEDGATADAELDDEGGCACNNTPGAQAGLAALPASAMLLLMARRRRRA